MKPGLIAASMVTIMLLAAAAVVRILAVPKFTVMPGRFQLFLEQMAAAVDGLGRGLKALGRGLLRAVIGLFRGIAGLLRGIVSLPGKLARVRLSKHMKRALLVWVVLALISLALSFVVGSSGHHSDMRSAMRDAVLHDLNRVSLFGLKDVNPGLISAMVVTVILLGFALIVRIFVSPRFKETPGKFQLLLETAVRTLDGL
ncbi:MAG: hypothetical protein IJ705_02140, partial [Oscillospiraceae bacterium]|nr:hypothetical protein [Oscillospiraceae bacterium]